MPTRKSIAKLCEFLLQSLQTNASYHHDSHLLESTPRKLSVWDYVGRHNTQQREPMLTLFLQADGIDVSFLRNT